MERRTLLASSLAFAAAASLPGGASGAPLAPFRLFDTHAHLRSDDPVRYPLRSDIEAVLRADVLARPLTPEALIAMWDDAGVEMGCGVQFNEFYYTDNRYLLDAADRYRDRISPVVVLDPTDPATPAGLAAMARAYGVSAVRFAARPGSDGNYEFLTDAARGGWDAANELGLTLVLLPAPPTRPEALPIAMAHIAEFAQRYPRLNIVIDHLGFPVAATTPPFGFSPQHLALAAHENVYFKYTTFLAARLLQDGVPTREFLNYAVDVYGAHRFVWGSAVGNNMIRTNAHAPVGAVIPSLDRYRDRVQLVLDSAEGLTVAQKRAIFFDNARALFIPGGRAPPRP